MPSFTTSVQLVNFYQLVATVSPATPSGAFAFYLIREGEVVEKTTYQRFPKHTFNLDRPGKYVVRGYSRVPGQSPVGSNSHEVHFRGFPLQPIPREERGGYLYCTSKSDLAAALIISTKTTIKGLCTPDANSTSTEALGFEVIPECPAGEVLIADERHAIDGAESFAWSTGADNALTRVLNRLSAMEIYRISRELYQLGIERQAHFLQMFVLAKYNTRLPYTAEIGEGTRLGVGGMAIAIHPTSKIGKDCVISQNVTIGSRARQPVRPEIGNNVFIGPGAVCLGGRIGNNVVVGANSVVTQELPDNCVVAGVPAKIISRDISKYNGYTHRKQ